VRGSTDATNLFLTLLGGFCAYSFVINLTMIGDDSSIGDPSFVKAFFFFPLLAFLPFFYQGQKSIGKYFAVVVVFGMTYHVLYSLVQIACYFAFGRVPSLAYPGGLTRFGGGWDDPNGFGAFLILPLLVVLSRRFVNRITRYIGLITILTLLALTISGTAIVGTTCAVLCYSAFKRRFLIIFAVVAPITIAITASPDLRNLIAFAYEAKLTSIQSHIDELSVADFFQNASVLELLLGQHVVGAKNESFYLAFSSDVWICGIDVAVHYPICVDRERDSQGGEGQALRRSLRCRNIHDSGVVRGWILRRRRHHSDLFYLPGECLFLVGDNDHLAHSRV